MFHTGAVPTLGERLNARLGRSIRPTGDGHRVTTLELLFDLVFVFCITSVTGFLEHHLSWTGVMEGVTVLLLVWFGWCAYTWLGNQARADEGLPRLALIVAMGGMFFVAISIPHTYDGEGNAAVVLAIAYAVVRLTHIAVYLVAAGDDRQLRSVLASMAAVAVAMLVPLWIGAFVGGDAQKWWWLLAVAIDQVGVYFVRSTRWRLPSASHFAERFGLVIIIAIGESIVAVGSATSSPSLTGREAVALVAGLTIAVCLWWLYFDVVALVAERVLHDAEGVRRVHLARDSYTYLHLPMVAGIVFAAMGLVLLIDAGEHVDAGRYALYGGIVSYLVGHLGFRLRNVGSINTGRAVVATGMLVAIPVLGGLDPLAQLVVPAIALVGLVAYEVVHNAAARHQVRGADAGHTMS